MYLYTYIVPVEQQRSLAGHEAGTLWIMVSTFIPSAAWTLQGVLKYGTEDKLS